MTTTTRTRRAIGLAEISALLLATIGIVANEVPQPATATPVAPYVVSTTSMIFGTTITSPWVLDLAGAAHWAIGVNSGGTGVLVRRDTVTGDVTSNPMEADETAASAGTTILGTTHIAFVVTLTTGGARIVVLDTATGSRVSSAALPAAAVGATSIASSSQGFLFVVTAGIPTTILKVTASTGAVASTLTFPASSSPATSAIARVGSLYVMSATSPTKVVVVKTNPGTAIDSTTSLTTTAPSLYLPRLGFDEMWYSTTTTPGRIIGFNISLKLVTADFPGPAGSVGVKTLTLDPNRETAWYTTTIAGNGVLVNMRLIDGAILSTTPLPSTVNPHSLFVTEHTVDVMNAVNAHVTRFAIIAPPSTPTGVTVLDRSAGITVSWNPDSTSIVPVRYSVSVSGNGQTVVCETSTTTCDFDNLTNGTLYSVRVRAISLVGFTDSAPSLGRPARLPDAPTGVTTTRGNRQIAVNWSPGFDGGRSVERFVAAANPGNHTCVTTAHGCVIGGLTNGVHYSITVHAETAVGVSPQRAFAETVMPATVPDKPELRATLVNGRNRTLVVCAANDSGGYRVTSLLARVVRAGVPTESSRWAKNVVIRIGRNTSQSLSIEVRSENALGESAPLIVPVNTKPLRVNSSNGSNRHLQPPCADRRMLVEIRP